MMSDPVIHNLLYALALATIASSLAIALVLILRKPLRRRFGAMATYAVWLLVPLAAASVLMPAPVITEVLPVTMEVVPKVAQPTPNAVVAAPTIQPIDISAWLLAAWLTGFAMALALFVRQQQRFIRGLGRLSRIDADTTIAQTTAGCPALVGAWRPRIVLPADFEQRYNSDERALILAHERNHRARGDAQINALVALLRGVFWFNPLIHFAAPRLRFDQELACDATVIARFPHARRSYADAMLKTQLAGIGLPIGCYWQATHPLKERIAMLKQPLPGRARSALGTALAATLIVGGTYVAWAAQPASQVAAFQSGKTQIQSDFKLTVDGEVVIDTNESLESRRRPSWRASYTSNRLVVTDELVHPQYKSGETYTMSVTKGAQSWVLETTMTAKTPDMAQVDVKITHNGKSVSLSPLIARYGQHEVIHYANDQGSSTGDTKGIRLDFTLSPFTAADLAKIEKTINSKPVAYKKLSPPNYPPSAVEQNIQGIVYVDVDVRSDGTVASSRVLSIDPASASILGKSALDAVNSWQFDPAQSNGVAVAGHAVVPVHFSIDGANSKHPETYESSPPPGALDMISVSAKPFNSKVGSAASAPSLRAKSVNAESHSNPASAPSTSASYKRLKAINYPAAEANAGQGGVVLVKAHISTDGDVESTAIQSGPGNTTGVPALTQAALNGVKGWSFEPATIGGKAVASDAIVPIKFVTKANANQKVVGGTLDAIEIRPAITAKN